MAVSVIIPTRNAAPWLARQLDMLSRQEPLPAEIILVDSASTDETLAIAARFPLVRVIEIKQEDFDHGGTRTLAAQAAQHDILVFLTQDAIPADDKALARLVAPLADSKIAATYGRQLPRGDASPLAVHLRLFNYPAVPEAPRFLADKERLGLRTIFCSNSFAAYRRDALAQAGFFPAQLLFGEDTFTVAKLLGLGYGVQYVSDALVYHSHNYTLMQEVKRYFDTGAFHAEAGGLFRSFGAATGAGRRFVLSEQCFLLRRGHFLLALACFPRNAAKLLAYKLGRLARHLPLALVRRLSMRPEWWARSL